MIQLRKEPILDSESLTMNSKSKSSRKPASTHSRSTPLEVSKKSTSISWSRARSMLQSSYEMFNCRCGNPGDDIKLVH